VTTLDRYSSRLRTQATEFVCCFVIPAKRQGIAEIKNDRKTYRQPYCEIIVTMKGRFTNRFTDIAK
jgi:hypothetical protein